MLAITDAATFRAELAWVKVHRNTVRLHAGIKYVTPDDEHTGRGGTIRKDHRDGLKRARLNRARRSPHRT